MALVYDHPKHTNASTRLTRFVALIAVAGTTASVYAAHPLITEDTGTQGKGRWQLEVNTEQSREASEGTTVRAYQPAATLSYGAADNVDLQITGAYLRQKSDGLVVSGKLDTALDLKWRFLERGPLSLALKPGITLPTGRDDQGFGTGYANWGSLLILSYELEQWAFHSHVGYQRNRNTLGARSSLKHISAALWFKPAEKLTLAMDLSRDTDPDAASNEAIRQAVAGIIYSVTPDFDLDAGYRRGSSAATDRAVLFGATLRW
jgi:hypothetical protein